MIQLDLEKAEEPEIKLPTSVGSLKKQESSRKTSTLALLTAKDFDCVKVKESEVAQSCSTLHDPDNHDDVITH